jgi:hypothetical protein
MRMMTCLCQRRSDTSPSAEQASERGEKGGWIVVAVMRVSRFERQQGRGGTYIVLARTCGTLDDMAKIWWAEFTKRS